MSKFPEGRTEGLIVINGRALRPNGADPTLLSVRICPSKPFAPGLRLATASFALIAAAALHGQDSAGSKAAPPPAQGTAAPEKEEVNVATTSMGASGGSVLGTVRNLNEVIEEQAGVTATLAPSASGAAAAGVIALAGNTTLSRVSIALNPVKGRIVLVGMDSAGDQVDLSTPEGASKLVLDKVVDGTEATLSVDVSKLTVKAILIYWVPDIPGDTLTLTRIGVFTRDPVAPPANPTPPVPAATPPPSFPLPRSSRPWLSRFQQGLPRRFHPPQPRRREAGLRQRRRPPLPSSFRTRAR